MNNKTLILLGTILLGFLAIAIVPKLFKHDASNKQELKNVSANLSSYSKESISKIEFGKTGQAKTLSIANNEWYINNEQADQTKVELFLNSLQDAEVLNLASKNEQNNSKFQVTPEDGITLKIFANGEEDEFYIGKRGPSIGTFYIRKKGIKNVYLMKGDFNNMLTLVESEWKNAQEEQQQEKPADET